jgi:hypothetical protein
MTDPPRATTAPAGAATRHATRQAPSMPLPSLAAVAWVAAAATAALVVAGAVAG